MKKIIITMLLIAIASSIFSEVIYLKDGRIYKDAKIVGIKGEEMYITESNGLTSIIRKDEVQRITIPGGGAVATDMTNVWLNKADFLGNIAANAKGLETMSDREFQLLLQQQQNAKLSNVAYAIWGSCILYIVYDLIRTAISNE